MIHIGYYQFLPEYLQKRNNLERIEATLSSYPESIDIMVLPELFATGYNFYSQDQVELLAEPAEGETYQVLRKIAVQKQMSLFGGFIEKDENKIYNSSLLVEPSGKYWVYRKAHLFNEEKIYFTRGNSALKPITLTIRNMKIKVGLMICFDWIFPEVARTLALQGAHLLLHSANLVLPYCPAASVTRALENRVFIVLADRIGKENISNTEYLFIGNSRIISPSGEILTQSDAITEEIRSVSINPFSAENKALNMYNDLFEDRRSDLYQL